MKITAKCPACQKPLEQVSKIDLSETEIYVEYKCGHAFVEPRTRAIEIDPSSADGNFTLRHYQIDGVKFILESNFNCLIGDQMRLGKTPQALSALRHKYEERTPCLIIVRAANLWQWIREYKVWVDILPNGIFPILGTKSFIPPGFKSYIISMDTFSRAGVAEKLKQFDFKLIIADEAHSFKNTDSNRSQTLVQFLKEKNFVEYIDFHVCSKCKSQFKTDELPVNGSYSCPNCETGYLYLKQELTTQRNCGIVLLTGTAVKNRADEYFVPLNLIAPTEFTSLERFRRRYLMQDSKGKWSRISPYAYESFKSAIKPYVLRREKEDVYQDLPELNRMFTLITVDKGEMAERYNKILDKMDAKLSKSIGDPSFWDYADDLMELRKITGMMKVMWISDYLEVMLESDPNSRIMVGAHHYDVIDTLKFKLSHLGVLKLNGQDSPEVKDYIMRHFRTSAERVLACNMVAGGVGMDFAYVENVLVAERMWSYADEQQFEFRAYNPDKDLLEKRGIGRDKKTNIEYIIARGTLDEWWYNMIEGKKIIQGETIGTNWDLKSQPKFFKSLLEETVSNRL